MLLWLWDRLVAVARIRHLPSLGTSMCCGKALKEKRKKKKKKKKERKEIIPNPSYGVAIDKVPEFLKLNFKLFSSYERQKLLF